MAQWRRSNSILRLRTRIADRRNLDASRVD